MSEISARCFLFVGNISATICKNLIFKIFYLVRKVFLICAKSDNKTNELISKSNKNNLNEKLMSFNDLVYMTSDNKVDSIDVEPSYVLLLSYLKDTSRDIWVLIYVKGDDVYVQADKRHANINLDTAGYDIYKSKYNKSQLEELMK